MEASKRIPLTQSSMGSLGACEELYRLKYIEGLRSRAYKPARSIGSAFHAGVEHGSSEEAERVYRSSCGSPWLKLEEEKVDADVAIIRAMVDGALSRWTVWPDRREVAFNFPLRNPSTGRMSTRHTLAGVIDGIFDLSIDAPEGLKERAQGRRFALCEYKTAGQVSPDYIRRLDLDKQITTYLVAASHLLGEPVRDMVYRVVRKPSIRPRKNETIPEYAERVQADYQERPDFYFTEVVISRSGEEIERWWHETWEVHRRVLRLENGEMPIRNVRSCLDFGRCDFLDLCRGVVTPEAYDVLDNHHPELPSGD